MDLKNISFKTKNHPAGVKVTISPARYASIKWAFVVIITLLLILIAAAYSIQRFNYWADLQEIVLTEVDYSPEYDQKSLNKILEEFASKEAKFNEIMNSFVTEPVVNSATSSLENVADLNVLPE